MKKYFACCLLMSFPIYTKSYFTKLKEVLRHPFAVLFAKKIDERTWSQQTPGAEILSQTEKLCTNIAREYQNEIAEVRKQLAYTKDATTTSKAEQQKFFDQLKQCCPHKSYTHNYLNDLQKTRKKLTRCKAYISQVEEISAFELRTKGYEKEAEILDKDAATLKQEYQNSITRAPQVMKTIDELQASLESIEKELTPLIGSKEKSRNTTSKKRARLLKSHSITEGYKRLQEINNIRVPREMRRT